MMQPPKIAPHHIHAVILAGGEGRRMGGADKGVALFHGQALAQRAAQRLGPSVGRVSISANRNLEQYQTLGFEVLSDGLASYEGPLGGVLAALRACTAPYLAVLPCDVPFFPIDLITQLANKLAASEAQIAMPLVTQLDGSVFPDPVFMLMRMSVLADLDAYFAAGGRKITTWAGKAGLALVPFNTPQDTQAFMDADTVLALDELAQR
jgi:molybdenum cofactor guanylyltransferase